MNDFYDIISENNGTWIVRLNENADVYRGHFPGRPIAPGVCNVEMIRQLASRYTGKDCHFREITQCRFTHLITPTKENELNVTIQVENNKLQATIYYQQTLCVQLKAMLQ